MQKNHEIESTAGYHSMDKWLGIAQGGFSLAFLNTINEN